MNPSLQGVITDVLREVVPSQEEKDAIRRLQDKLLTRAYAVVKQRYSIEPVFTGSIAKGTWMAGAKDIDLFLMFHERVPRDELERTGLDVAKQIVQDMGGRWEIAYAEHPYLRAQIEGHKVDIVPAYDVKDASKIKSAVDRTPHHVRYIQSALDKNLLNEVRLLKKFCVGAGVYGSDLKTEGFSGYLCELLVVEYGTFEDVLRAVVQWRPGTIIDVEEHHAEASLKKKFPHDPLVVIDPVDPNRNVAAVLSLENFLVFIRRAREFLQEPKFSAFFRLPVMAPSMEELQRHLDERQTRFVFIRFSTPDVLDDVLWPQLRKCTERVRTLLEENEFEVLRTGIWSSDVATVLVIELLVDELPAIQKRRGPSAFDAASSKSFLDHYRGYNVFLEDGFWAVEFKRKNRNAMELLRAFLGEGESELRAKGVPSYVAAALHEDVELATGEHVARLLRRFDSLRAFMYNYFHRNLV
ncbi:MAG: CCA tRNA nucleotidyltransferase [Candidatus Aenigmatarchaeota archaeon]|nr:MAG: CCA tRNA nucleotidyltransferase [Candidatus Aenigmarchaeota archaeon]